VLQKPTFQVVSEDAHRWLRPQDDLERVFARKDKRKLSKNLTFQHQGILYMVQTKSPNRLKYATVEVLRREGKPIEVEYQGIKLKYKKWSEVVYEQPKILDSKEIAVQDRPVKTRKKPAMTHPWR